MVLIINYEEVTKKTLIQSLFNVINVFQNI